LPILIGEKDSSASSGEEGLDYDSNSWTCVLDNEDGKLGDPDLLNTEEDVYVKPYKLMQVKAGHMMTDGTRVVRTVYTGAVITPTLTEALSQRVTIRLANLAWLCQQVKAKGDWPCFDGWVIRDGLEWLALKCRIDISRQRFTGEGEGDAATGVNQKLSRGTPTNPLWQANLNETGAWEMMKKMADYIKYDLFIDREGNLICQPQSVSFTVGDPYDFTFFPIATNIEEAADWNNASDVELALQGEDWYNTVWIGGFKEGGGAIAAFRTDPDTIYDPTNEHFMGFEKGPSGSFDYISTQDKCEELVDIAFNEKLMFPRRISFTTWFNEELEPGKIMKMINSKHKLIGTAEKPVYYRIINLSHDVQIKSLSTTTVVGDFVGEGVPEEEEE
jgi:hypothetical protein